MTTTPAARVGQGVAARRSTSAGVQATLSVLELLGARAPLSLSALARELGLARGTLHRICSVLVERYWVVRDESGRFHPGIRAVSLAAQMTELPIVTAFRSVAVDLLTRHDETVCLAVLDGDDAVFIAVEETSHAVRLVTRVGSRSPAFASASGRVILAGRPPTHIEAGFGGRSLVTPTGRRLNGVAELRAILDDVRQNGYSENHDDTAIGLYAMAVPVRKETGVILAALTVCILTSRMSDDRRVRVVADMLDAGEHLSQLVAWLPGFNVRHPAATSDGAVS